MAEVAKAVARSSWSGKWAFILAAAASAVGLGNMWRFPYLAAKYGGGMFLCTYLVLVFTFGVSMLILEISIGRKTGQSAITAFKALAKKWAPLGILVSSIPFIITPYYCIIGGWVMKYAASYVSGGALDLANAEFFGAFITSPVESFIWMFLFMGVTIAVVAMGVKGGIEKANLVMMPALILMAVAVAVYTMTLDGALEGVLYYIKPDFSKFSPELVIGALGQMFYSLSLAMGIMITYGSYLKKKEDIVQSACRVGAFDFGVSFLAGLMIVPASFVALGGADAVASKAGPGLMFGTLPGLFADFGSAAGIIGAVFFILVLFAALTSSISLTETLVSIVVDTTGRSRKASLVIVAVFLFVAGAFINMGYNLLAFIEPLGPGTSLLDFADFLSNSVFMPIAALLTCIFVGWILGPNLVIDEVKTSGNFKAAKPWTIMIKFIAPVLVVIILVAYVAATFGFFSM